MSLTWRNLGVGLAGTLALLMVLALGLTTVFAQGPMRVSGGGEAVAAEFVTYHMLAGGTVDVPSIGTIGNRFTFGFNGTKDSNGNVQGQMQLVDHDLGLTIHSDVADIDTHPNQGAPVGTGDPPGVSFRMSSSTESVIVNGESRPGWQIRNSPTFDGGEPGADKDTVCFELFNAAGDRILQWSAFLSSGNVQIKP